MNDLTRYELNEHGEIPLSYGRYVRWEDCDDLLQELLREIEGLERELRCKDENYSVGWDDGYEEGKAEGRRWFQDKVIKLKDKLVDIAEDLNFEE